MFSRPAMLITIVIMLPLVTLHMSSAAPLESKSNSQQKSSSDDPNDDSRQKRSSDDQNVQKRGCRMGIGNPNCLWSALDNDASALAYLQSDMSPGKRDSADLQNDADKRGSGEASVSADRLLRRSLKQQLTAMSTLQNLLNRVRSADGHEGRDALGHLLLKKTCNFRLGNHCLTEALDRAASQYYYLLSADSPGRKRRAAGEGPEGEVFDTYSLEDTDTVAQRKR